MKPQVILIEDDDALRMSLAQTLDIEGITVIQADGLAQAKRAIRANFAGVILSDIRMPHYDGFDVLAHVKDTDPDLPVVLLTGEADVPMALRAMKEGAYDFLEKPCATETLLKVLYRAISHRSLITQTRSLEQKIRHSDAASVHFPGKTPASRNLRSNLRRVAPLPVHVHLYGPRGVGKKLAAYTIHNLSQDRDVNLAINLQDAQADEIATLNVPDAPCDLSLKNVELASPAQQADLLALIHAHPNLRVILSSIHSMDYLMKRGFSEDLFSALNLVEINVPTLKRRRDDLPVLFEGFARHTARALNTDMPQVPQSVYANVMAKEWNGNLPELRNYARTIVLGLSVRKHTPQELTLAQQMDAFEKLVLSETLKRNKGKAVDTAKSLGLPRKTFYDRLARYDLRPKDFKQTDPQ
ncbi:sigma-54-dependent Fis family transcriptional regulator [Amylibacter ulvae]|uniref:Sigma-54-dependent Fis family transcriptional regulator n=1 Tax=Paramylibacter ulvae TaxID=1651968 RepID=A0ABQ3D633_9RHOB|nr:response regulator [Amylibacter ulvae]GHA58819.1 sigma-54-dependent Fis family transcriptional regulator [Amylibacter ulvae]